MKKSKIVLTCLLLMSTFIVLCACTPNAENRERSVIAVNHRGYGDAPENTLAAFRLSKEMGFDYVECDVCFTKDSQAVLLHDGTVNRTSNGKGKIADLTLEEVRQLDFGSWKDASYAGERIPTFAEFVDLCVELELRPYVEIKGNATFAQIESLVDTVDGLELNVTWISRDRTAISWLSELRSEDRFGLVLNLIDNDDVQFLADLSRKVEVFADTNYLTLTQRQIENCKLYDIPIEVWTVNSQTVIESLNAYVSGVTSDYINAQTVFNNMK